MDFGSGLNNWIILLGGSAGALLAVWNLFQRMSEMIIRVNKQIEAIDTVQTSLDGQTNTMNEVMKQLMSDNEKRMDNEKRLGQAESGLNKLRLDTEERTNELASSLKTMDEDIKGIRQLLEENLKKGDI